MFQTKVVEKMQTHFVLHNILSENRVVYDSVSQPPGRGPVSDPGFNYSDTSANEDNSFRNHIR
jgi:hypothetical protein